MEKSAIIEKFGGLVKTESLTCLEDSSLMHNACLLEARKPFSGYYNDVPGAKRPLYLYLVLEHSIDYTAETIIRATEKVKSEASFTFDAAFGSVHFFDRTCPIIRVRDLGSYGNIRELQELYKAAGLEYRKKVKSFTDEEGLITLNKLFYLSELGDGMWIDRSQPHHAYFLIPRHLDFETFNKITTEVKYDTSLLYFDAAYAWYFEGKGIQNMIRIYREDLTIEKITAIRDRYLSIIK
ncbi:MAG: hypothetical protein K0B15_12165 [Lentimicrobium sp.]|nr:hypothetical protein [Lentimicrobium sp.]